MTLPNGDNFVSGSILSYQQSNRIKNHWHGASAPSSPVAGMVWVDSDDGVAYVYFDGSWVALGGGAGGNLLSNSGFGVCSQSALTDIDAQISVTDIAAGVCTTADTQNLQVGDLVKFNGGGTTGTNVYEVTALTADTNFTIHDTSITDGTNVTCDEATPAFIAADVYAPDTWTKTATLDLYRWFNHTTYHKGMYGLQVTKGANGAEYLNAFGSIASKDQHYLRFRGRTVTFGCWVYSVTAADNVKLQINDSGGTTESSFVAANTLTWVEITRTCGASITSFTPRILFDGDTSDVAYVSRPMLVFGSSIGEGNYQPKQQEWIYCVGQIQSNKFHATAGFTTEINGSVNSEADSNGKIPKGAKAILLRTVIHDSGSAGDLTIPSFICRSSTSAGYTHSNYGPGKLNDSFSSQVGPVACNEDGDYIFSLTASGAGTLDVAAYYYTGVQVS